MAETDGLTSAQEFSETVQNCLATDPGYLDELIQGLLQSVRKRLGMEVAFVSEFLASRRVFRYVDAEEGVDIIPVDCSEPLSEGYCTRVVNGTLPELVVDARKLSGMDGIPAKRRAEIGAHVSVPIKLSDGRVYGTFCALSRYAAEGISERDLTFVRVCADITGGLIETRREVYGQGIARRTRIMQLLETRGLTMALQPVKSLTGGHYIGFEALTRVTSGEWPPDVLFADAEAAGLGSRLGIFTVNYACDLLTKLPQDVFIAINVCPQFILDNDLGALLPRALLPRIVLEITEHVAVAHYGTIANVLAPLRARGLRLAVDDAGAGYASFRHILTLRPDIIKLDISLIHNIDRDAEKQALADLMISFARQRGYQLIAEGVETEAELEVLLGLGVEQVQGYLIARPQPLQHFFPDS